MYNKLITKVSPFVFLSVTGALSALALLTIVAIELLQAVSK